MRGARRAARGAPTAIVRALALAVAAGVALALAGSACTETNPAYLVWKDGGGNQDKDAADAGASDGGETPDAPRCQQNEACAGDPRGPYCHADSGACVRCTATEHCRGDGGTQVCDPVAHACVQCAGDADCGGGLTPVCEAHACRACKADSECKAAPGICLRDGHCASPNEVVYVKNPPSCSSTSGNGSAAAPYCTPQEAISALGAGGRNTVVLLGPDVLGGWMLSAQPPGIDLVTVVGRDGALVSYGGTPGLRLAGGARLHVRDVAFTGGLNLAVRAESNSELIMERCLVQNNALGGISIDGAGYDITNTVIASNGAGLVGSTSWGGVYFGAVAAGKVARFVNNTVVANRAPGVACSGTMRDISASIISGNTSLDDAGCSVASCCGAGDPRFTADFRLMAGSPCIDRVPPAMSPPFDIDGQARPQGTMSDCGADEYVAGP